MPHVRVDVDRRAVAQTRKALKRIHPSFEKDLLGALKDAADSAVVDARLRMARDLASTQTVRAPRRTGRAAKSIKAAVSGGRVYVRGGGTKATAYYGWLDYGGDLKRTGTTRPARVNEQRRPVKKEGRYIYPAVQAKRHIVKREIRETLERAIKEVEYYL